VLLSHTRKPRTIAIRGENQSKKGKGRGLPLTVPSKEPVTIKFSSKSTQETVSLNQGKAERGQMGEKKGRKEEKTTLWP